MGKMEMKPSEILQKMPKDKWLSSGWYEWNNLYCISGWIINELFGEITARSICDFGDMLRIVDKSTPVPLKMLWDINDNASTHEVAVRQGIQYLRSVGL